SSLLSPTLDFRSLSLHDALPISHNPRERAFVSRRAADHTTPLRNVLPARWRSSLCHGTLLFQVVPGPALAAALAATLRDDLTALFVVDKLAPLLLRLATALDLVKLGLQLFIDRRARGLLLAAHLHVAVRRRALRLGFRLGLDKRRKHRVFLEDGLRLGLRQPRLDLGDFGHFLGKLRFRGNCFDFLAGLLVGFL